MPCKISKVTLEVGRKKIELTLSEVKELKMALDSLIEEKTVYSPSYPYYPTPRWNDGIWCSTSGDIKCSTDMTSIIDQALTLTTIGDN